MDQRQAERVNQLAASLKELHIVSSTEEAYARAKEIILGTGSDDGKSIKQMFKEQGFSDELKQEVDELKHAETEERLDSNELAAEIKRVEQTLRDHEKRLDDAHKILDKARAMLKHAKDGTLIKEHEYFEKRKEPVEEPHIETYDEETQTTETSEQAKPEKKQTIDDMASRGD